MIRDLTELAALAALGGTLFLSGCGGSPAADTDAPATDTPATDTDEPITDTDDTDEPITDTDSGCPTGGCPTGGCPTGGCPTGGCPTGGCPTTGCPTGGCPTTGCPTGGCPTTGCPTGGCPTTGCPTSGCPTSGYVADFATNTDFFTMTPNPVAGGSVHGTVRIFYSETLRSAIEAGGPFTAPVGATSVKEVYDANGDVDFLVTMTKQAAGYDTDANDWLYERRATDGSVLESGAIEMCIGCHVGGASTDYLLGTAVESNP